jgi:hypothetical protein
MKRCALAVLLAGCASGGNAAQSDAPVGGGPDAKVWLDGSIEGNPDAAPHIDAAIDARPDAPVDAAPMIDAPPDACVPVTTELLLNPVFDLTPIGVNWTSTPIDSAYPLIGSEGPAPHTAPYKAWLGGLSGQDVGQLSATDLMYQDVTVPPGTTQLVLTGYYLDGTSEDPGETIAYDNATVDLLQTNGSPIEHVLSLSNLTPVSAYTLFTHTFTANVSGQTVRLRFTSTNDSINATGWVFDTLSLKATHCP